MRANRDPARARVMTRPKGPAVAPAGRAACRFCGAPLDPHQAARGAVCAASTCERKRVQEASRMVFQRNWDDYVERQHRAAGLAAPDIAQALRMLDAGSGEVAIGVVPHLDRRLVPLPEDRLAEFAVRLDEIIAGAFAEPLPEMELTTRERDEADEHPLIGATCATCQGMCCTLGGPQQAFLTVSDMQRFRLRHPEADAAAIRAHYLGRLPQRSVEHACVFQSQTGCALDRAERADICNRYHCNPQTHLLTRMREMKAQKAVIIGHEGDAGPVVGAFDMRTGLERLRDARRRATVPDPAETAAALDAALAQIPAPMPKPPPLDLGRNGAGPGALVGHDAEAETPEPLAMAIFDPETGLRQLPGPEGAAD